MSIPSPFETRASSTALVWLRQDLRLQDNPALYAACSQHRHVIPLYILDPHIPLGGAQKWWLHHSLRALGSLFQERGMNLGLYGGASEKILLDVVQKHGVSAVYWNESLEPLLQKRDESILKTLEQRGLECKIFPAHRLCDPRTLRTATGGLFQVFTPFWKACMSHLHQRTPPEILEIPTKNQGVPLRCDALEDWGLLPSHPNWAKEFSQYWTPGPLGAEEKWRTFVEGGGLFSYGDHRDYPALEGTSRLSPHLHFGEISPWALWRKIQEILGSREEDFLDKGISPRGAKRLKEEGCSEDSGCIQSSCRGLEVFLSQLGWREFSYYLLHHFPDLPERNFKNNMDNFPWRYDAHLYKAWTEGKTGYPLVDAGMRQLWRTGTMHNRVRMVVASFLTKNLRMDWRLGAQWFMDTLLDADVANNGASWQWVAGCGADAAPYFRVFNPILQGQKFDPEGIYIKKWIPELGDVPPQRIHDPEKIHGSGLLFSTTYPQPVVDLRETRRQALEAYASASRTIP